MSKKRNLIMYSNMCDSFQFSHTGSEQVNYSMKAKFS